MPTVNSAEALKNRFMTALQSGGKVYSREAKSIIALAKDGGGVTQSERRQLRELFVVHGDSFGPVAKKRMENFINNEIPGLLIDDPVVTNGSGKKDLADPAVQAEDKGKLKYQWVDAKLFVNGADDDDVMQGYIGDCYLVAGFAAVAAHHPEVIENAIKDNKDGTYTVRFYESSWSGSARPVDVTIDGQMPTNNGGMYYGKNREKGELWVGLLEKAYAQWKGGYDAIGQGGSAGDVMSALTGRRDDYLWISKSTNHSEIYRKIETAISSGKAVAAGTHGEDEEALYKGTGVYAHHAYSISGVSTENGVKYVHLRNPWGEVEPSGNGPDDGHFKLDMQTFLKLYAGVYVA